MHLRADNVRGLKPSAEAWDRRDLFRGDGRGALRAGRSRSASSGGLPSSEDAGMSSAKTGENPVHRKPKVSAARLVRCRSVGPKARAKAVVDGCQVYIPEPGVEVDPGRTLPLGMIWSLVCQSAFGPRAKPFGGRRSHPRGGPRKAVWGRHARPYRKPTQVGR